MNLLYTLLQKNVFEVEKEILTPVSTASIEWVEKLIPFEDEFVIDTNKYNNWVPDNPIFVKKSYFDVDNIYDKLQGSFQSQPVWNYSDSYGYPLTFQGIKLRPKVERLALSLEVTHIFWNGLIGIVGEKNNVVIEAITCYFAQQKDRNMQYRKKPVTIEAVQNLPENIELIKELANDPASLVFFDDGTFKINTLEGTMMANVGDWIIKGVKGELYPCRSDIFEQTYELANIHPQVRFTKEEAFQLLQAESTCYGEGQAGIPQYMLQEIKQCYPKIAEQFSWVYPGVKVGENIQKPVLHVKHSELQREGDSSFRSQCPVCKEGLLLVGVCKESLLLVDGNMQLLRNDVCRLCGQQFHYTDDAIAGISFMD